MEPDDYLDFLKTAAANERQHTKDSLSDVLDAGDRMVAQFAASEVISAAALMIREQERENPTVAT